MQKTRKLTPSIDLLLPSARLIKDNLAVFFVLLVVPLLLSSIANPMPELSPDATYGELLEAYQSTITPFMVIGSVLTVLLYPLLAYAQWRVTAKQQVSLHEVAVGAAPFYWRLLGLSIVTTAVVCAGLVAFVIPGLIFLRGFILAPYYLLQKDLGIIESMKVAMRQSKPYSWSIYGILAIIALYAMVSIVGVIGQIITTILLVLYSLALPLRYHEIRRAAKR